MRFGLPGDRQFGAAGSLFEVILSLFEVILGALEGHWATLGVFFRVWGKKLKKRSVLEAKVAQRGPKWIPEGS